MRQRFDDFATRFAEHSREWGARAAASASAHASKDDYWRSVHELFTRDVTQKGLRELFEHETRETFRFFTRELETADLAGKPWYQRYPAMAWRVFLAMAYRLSPWRRILFAVAVPVLCIALVRHALSLTGPRGFPSARSSESWLLVAATFLFFLLVLELRDKLALKGDLEVARQIQFGLLPFEPYSSGGTEICASMRPANTVGGDYFDVIDLEAGRIAVVVGDVAGKGMPAALLMALLQGSLRTLISAGFRGPELIGKLNDHLYANIPSNRLITLFYGELDNETGALSYVNSGHNPPFLMRAGGAIERLAATAVALGVVETSSFEALEIGLGAGDRLLLYTDGITEAFDPREEEYGEPRLQAFLTRHGDHSHRELIDALLVDVLEFCGSARPRDDMTLLALGRTKADASGSAA